MVMSAVVGLSAVCRLDIQSQVRGGLNSGSAHEIVTRKQVNIYISSFIHTKKKYDIYSFKKNYPTVFESARKNWNFEKWGNSVTYYAKFWLRIKHFQCEFPAKINATVLRQ